MLALRLALAAFLLAGCLSPATAPATTPAPAATPTRAYPLPQLNSPEYGLHVSIWWHVDNKDGARDMDLVREAGFGWVKQVFAWSDISNAPGEYYWGRTDAFADLAEARGLKVLARLDHAPEWALRPAGPGVPPFDAQAYADFCGRAAARYRGRIAAYEVWNEPNLVREWNGQPPDPAGYAALLKPCYLAIKQADPQAVVISAGLATTGTDDTAVAMPDDKYFRGLYEAGAAPYFDVLGVHAPGYLGPPERSPEEALADPLLQARWLTFRHVEDIRAIMLEAGDGGKQIAITEMGFTSDSRPDSPYTWHAVSEELKAEYLARAYRYAREHWQPWISLMVTIYIADPAWTDQDEQYWWSITRPTRPGDPPDLLPAYEALRDMEK